MWHCPTANWTLSAVVVRENFVVFFRFIFASWISFIASFHWSAVICHWSAVMCHWSAVMCRAYLLLFCIWLLHYFCRDISWQLNFFYFTIVTFLFHITVNLYVCVGPWSGLFDIGHSFGQHSHILRLHNDLNYWIYWFSLVLLFPGSCLSIIFSSSISIIIEQLYNQY